MRAYRLGSHRHIAQNCIRGTCLEIPPPFKRLLKLIVSIFVSIHYFATRWGTSDEASANLNVAVFRPFRRDAPAPTHYGRRRSTLGCGSIFHFALWGRLGCRRGDRSKNRERWGRAQQALGVAPFFSIQTTSHLCEFFLQIGA